MISAARWLAGRCCTAATNASSTLSRRPARCSGSSGNGSSHGTSLQRLVERRPRLGRRPVVDRQHAPLLAVELVQARVGGDPVQPRAQRRAALEVAAPAPGAQAHLLQDVLGVVRGAEHPVAVRAQFGAEALERILHAVDPRLRGMARRPRRKGGTMRTASAASSPTRPGARACRPRRSSQATVCASCATAARAGTRARPPSPPCSSMRTATARPPRTPIGRATAAEAEYRAILLGLQLAAGRARARSRSAATRSWRSIACARGDGPVEVVEAAGAFTDVRWVWHPRADIEAVDALVRELLWPRFGRPVSGHQPGR